MVDVGHVLDSNSVDARAVGCQSKDDGWGFSALVSATAMETPVDSMTGRGENIS